MGWTADSAPHLLSVCSLNNVFIPDDIIQPRGRTPEAWPWNSYRHPWSQSCSFQKTRDMMKKVRIPSAFISGFSQDFPTGLPRVMGWRWSYMEIQKFEWTLYSLTTMTTVTFIGQQMSRRVILPYDGPPTAPSPWLSSWVFRFHVTDPQWCHIITGV